MDTQSTAVFWSLRIERDVKVPLRDGSFLMADVFRPEATERFPVIMTLGPYSKDIHFRDWNPRIDYESLPERGPYMSDATDADLFVIVRKLDREGREVRFPGQSSPAIAAAYGWLRASHRKLDASRSTPWRPYHTHDELQPLAANEITPVEIEIWPTSVVFEPGERLVLEVASRDDDGVDPFVHDHPADRIQRGVITLHCGGPYDAHLLVPIIPAR